MTKQTHYKVGYGRPPRETRFPSGVSGNPNGRPKGSKSLGTIVAQMCAEKVTVSSGGKTRTITKMEAIVMQLSNKAASGDIKAIREIIALSRVYVEDEQTQEGSDISQERDIAVVKGIFERMNKSDAKAAEKEK